MNVSTGRLLKAFTFLFLFLAFVHVIPSEAQTIELKDWQMINATEIGRADEKWYDVQVPTTVLNALVKQGVYPDPRIGLNNYLIPDVSDEFNRKHDLAKYNYLKSGRNPWQDPYVFKTQVKLPSSYRGRKVWLTLYGINYRADVWMNGHKVACKDEIVGMFRRFRLDVSDYALAGKENEIVIKTYQVDHPGVPTPGTQLVPMGPPRGNCADLFQDETLKMSGGWDCAPVVRDRNMGIYQKVTISATDEVTIDSPFVSSTLVDTASARLNIKAELVNHSDKTIKGRLDAAVSLLTEIEFPTYIKKMSGKMKPVRVSREVCLAPGEKMTVELDGRDFPQLDIEKPHLWYPNGYGEQWLHHLKLSFTKNGRTSDSKEVDFGIREVKHDFLKNGDDYGRTYYVNGKRIFCKGGWIQPDILLDENAKNIYDQVRLMALAGVNLIGSEDMPSPREEWLEACDRYGVMWWHVFYQCYRMVPGRDNADNPLDKDLAIAGVEDMMLRYRNHPSIISWVGVNEVLMNESLYRRTKAKVKELDTTRDYFPTTSYHWDVAELTPYFLEDLPTGTTDDGGPDYNWEKPEFYFRKINEVHLQMFKNELGTPSMPEYGSLKRFMPNLEKADPMSPIFPLDSTWAEHGAWDANNFCYRSYDNANRTMFGGTPKTVQDYADNAQILNADGYRAMFEAANHRMWDITTGVMIWKINSCWPDVGWQLYDWYLQPNASYYFAKKAMEPRHIQLNAHDFTVSVINAAHSDLSGVKARVKVINYDMSEAWTYEAAVDVAADSYKEVVKVPQNGRYSYNYFVKLELEDVDGKLISDNLYWFYSQHSSLILLPELRKTEIDCDYAVTKQGGEYVIKVSLKNESDKPAFMKRLSVVDADGNDIAPVFWSDNYITLFPGESKNLSARVAVVDANGDISVKAD